MEILDSIEEIKKIDRSNMLSFCIEASKHYEKASKLAQTIQFNYTKPKTIVVAGMGGSAIGGELLKDWAKDKISVPIEVNREYHLPAYANKNTLLFVLSYSGETEESLSVFLEGIKKHCIIFCVSSGGTLIEIAEKIGIPYIRIPSRIPPRAALPYLFLPMLTILSKTNLFSSDIRLETREAIGILEKVVSENSPEKPTKDNFSKKLALEVNGTLPVIYGFGIYRSVAQRFKQQFNENSKILARWEFFPELNHNEIVGWESINLKRENFSAIFIRDKKEPNEIRERVEVTKGLIEKHAKILEVWSQGETTLAKMLTTICIGDFASVYLAILRGVDPTPVKTIAFLKEQIKQYGLKEKIICELQKLAKKSR